MAWMFLTLEQAVSIHEVTVEKSGGVGPTPPDEFLTQAGFRLVRRKLGSFGLLHSDLWERHAR